MKGIERDERAKAAAAWGIIMASSKLNSRDIIQGNLILYISTPASTYSHKAEDCMLWLIVCHCWRGHDELISNERKKYANKNKNIKLFFAETIIQKLQTNRFADASLI